MLETGIYVRVSTEEQAQEGYSIRAQEQKLRDYAKIKEWPIYKIYIDEGISGKNITARPAVTEMIDDIEKGRVKNVLVYKIDRLTRSTADLLYLINLFNDYDCAFNSLNESIDTQSATGRMFIKIIGIFAEFERENISERVRLGFERKAREGFISDMKTVEILSNSDIVCSIVRFLKSEGENVFTGIVASGDQFIADNNKSKEISSRFSAIAVEMEGGAIAQVCACAKIVISVIILTGPFLSVKIDLFRLL